jgi:hypothetical protein
MQPVYKKYEFAIADPKTWQTMEADFNNVVSLMIAGGALQGTVEVLAGFAWPVTNVRVKVTAPDDPKKPPSIEFRQTTDTSRFHKDWSKFPEVVACEAAQLHLILVDAVNAAATDWKGMPADTAEYQDEGGNFGVWLKLQADGSLLAAYPERDDYTRFNLPNKQFLVFKSLGIKRAKNEYPSE